MCTMLTNYEEEDVENWLKCAKAAHDLGVNYFDSAEIYGFGDGDRMLGRAVKEFAWRREDLVIGVKIFKAGFGANAALLSRKHIIEGCRDSLERMGLDYCDLVFAHVPDYVTPLEETCRAFNWLIKKGYAKYWCTSNWPPVLITEAMEICDELGLAHPIADQCQYNALLRDNVEKLHSRMFDEYGYGSTVWSPLCGGLLSGKYNDGTIPADSSFGRSEVFKGLRFDKYLNEDTKEKYLKLFKGLEEIAAELDCKQSELVLAWVIVNKDVSTCIFGATKVSQVESNVKAIEIAEKWTPEIEEKINKVLQNEPSMEMNWKTWSPYPSRRSFRVDYNFKPGQLNRYEK